MGLIEDLVGKVPDEFLRGEIQAAVANLKQGKRFGLVFEEHIPETSALLDYPVRPGALVELRREPQDRATRRVTALSHNGSRATIVRTGESTEEASAALDDLLVVKPFGDPIYPALRSVGVVDRGGSKPHHAVIDAENFHALQLLVYLYAGQVDCIYIDPPYNTGAKDWKYNNHYVDANDTWRHSKWLSMMDRRLKLAAKLLKPDGVLIVTIDEHEVNHLGVLLEQRFPRHLRYMVTSVINPKGTFKVNFGRVDEQIFFVVPDSGVDVIVPRPRSDEDFDTTADSDVESLIRGIVAASDIDPQTFIDEPSFTADQRETLRSALGLDEDVAEEAEGEEQGDTLPDTNDYEFWFLRRRGQESSYRTQRPNQFYAIHVNEKTRQVVGIGPQLTVAEEWASTRDGDVVSVYPVDNDGHERVWRYSRPTMQAYIDADEIVVGRFNEKTQSWTLNHRKLKKDVLRNKTVWWYKSHDAGVHGTNVVNRLLGARNLFPFPKSIYAVRDTLAAVVRDRPDALILDFFAGSGTTLHATCMLNADDGGRRRCILVTNNEVDEKQTAALHKQGIFRGDAKFEAHGIFEQATKPRCEAAITGKRPDGKPVPGRYNDGRLFADGFEENAEFFRLGYLDPDDVDLGHQFAAILPALWLAAAGIGPREVPKPSTAYTLPTGATYGVLFRESRFRQFHEALMKRPDVTHVWLVTDSEEAFAEMAAVLPSHLRLSMLYRDYLHNFRINTDRNL